MLWDNPCDTEVKKGRSFRAVIAVIVDAADAVEVAEVAFPRGFTLQCYINRQLG